MTDKSLEEKHAQYNEYFSIAHELNVNVIPLAEGQPLPDNDDIIKHMPYAFRMAGEIALLETKALRPLRSLGDHAAELAEFLNQQSKKIDLMMSYVLHQQDDHSHRYTSVEFGGGGVIICSDEPFESGSQHQLKLFIEEEATAVFCYGEVVACEALDDEQHKVTFIYSRIREQDQEILVRASLHLQTRLIEKTFHSI